MNAVTKTGANPSAAHLHVVSDRGAGGTPGIQLSGVSKTYRSRDGDVPSLRPLDFHINSGEFFVVVGPSGCGKSTLLKMISGLLPPSTGEISVEGGLEFSTGRAGEGLHSAPKQAVMNEQERDPLLHGGVDGPCAGVHGGAQFEDGAIVFDLEAVPCAGIIGDLRDFQILVEIRDEG